MEIITKAEFARRVGVSKPRISQLVSQGLPVLADGRIDLAAGLAWISQHVDRSQATRRGGASRTAGREARVAPGPAPAPAAPAFRDTPSETGRADAGAVLLRAKAKKAIVDFERAQRIENVETGRLAPIADLHVRVDALIRNARGRLLSVGHRIGPRVAIESDPLKCTAMIDDALREALSELESYKGEGE